MNAILDTAIRLAAFRWLSEATAIHGDVLPRTLLQQGFEFQGERIPLVSPQGIFKPRLMDLPLSITTTSGGPYNDAFGPDGLLTLSNSAQSTIERAACREGDRE